MYSVSQHCTIWRSDHRVFHLSTLYHMAVRSLCSVTTRDTRAHAHTHARTHARTPVNTIPHRHRVFSLSAHGGQIIVYSVSQHCTIWRSDHRVFHLSTPHHMAVRSLCIIPVNTIPHGTQIVYSTSEQCTTWWSDRAFRQPVLKWLS